MKSIEDRDEWLAGFRAGWSAHLDATGETDFKQYRYVKNVTPPDGRAVDPAAQRVLLVTTSGAYLASDQAPFDAPNPRGDASTRTFPLGTPLEAIAFAHDHFDHRYVNEDPQVVLPLRHLEAMAAEGRIGSVADTVVSFSGYLPDATQVEDEIAPVVLDVARREAAHVALLVPV